MTVLANQQAASTGATNESDLTQSYQAVRSLTEELVAPLSAEDQTVQSMPDVSPTKWHRAHVSWFFETFLLRRYLPGYREFHPMFGYLFNSYYEAVGARYPRPARGLVSRPGVAEIRDYRRHVDEHMIDLLRRSNPPELEYLVELGCHHEQQHQELLLMDIKHVLSQSPLEPAYQPPAPRPTPTPNGAGTWLAHGGGLVQIGYDGAGFAFDNEGPAHLVHLAPFELAGELVTCGAWREFMADGGYERAELWLSDGWAARGGGDWRAPLYWREDDGGWSVFTLTGRKPVDANEPVCHVSYYEADAFARWAGARLPTEFEYEAVAGGYPVEGRFLDPADPHTRPQSRPALFGDAWAWTASAYLPYPGFRPAAGAVGEYNGKFMVNQHVLRGGAAVTPVGHVRASYRNFFPPGARWPFTGVRLARDL
ncbi:MAG: ergothioneine biosynthesis protein EgtB [Mycobacteriales bacterium]